jgi:broad specificity phosphatase PhoE
MKYVRLIRHGESASNTGEASLDRASIPPTARGVEKAHLVAGSFAQAPTLIIASPLSRAQSTAMATVVRFAAIPLETWPIHEFTYLEPPQ